MTELLLGVLVALAAPQPPAPRGASDAAESGHPGPSGAALSHALRLHRSRYRTGWALARCTDAGCWAAAALLHRAEGRHADALTADLRQLGADVRRGALPAAAFPATALKAVDAAVAAAASGGDSSAAACLPLSTALLSCLASVAGVHAAWAANSNGGACEGDGVRGREDCAVLEPLWEALRGRAGCGAGGAGDGAAACLRGGALLRLLGDLLFSAAPAAEPAALLADGISAVLASAEEAGRLQTEAAQLRAVRALPFPPDLLLLAAAAAAEPNDAGRRQAGAAAPKPQPRPRPAPASASLPPACVFEPLGSVLLTRPPPFTAPLAAAGTSVGCPPGTLASSALRSASAAVHRLLRTAEAAAEAATTAVPQQAAVVRSRE